MKVQFDSDEFQATYSETCDLFAKYQMAIHKDSPGECGERQVRLFCERNSFLKRTATL